MTCRKTSALPRLGRDFRGIRLVGGSRGRLGALTCILYAQIALGTSKNIPL